MESLIRYSVLGLMGDGDKVDRTGKDYKCISVCPFVSLVFICIPGQLTASLVRATKSQ